MKSYLSLTRAVFVGCAVVFASTQTSRAARVGGFEPGDPSFSIIGDAGVVQTFQGVAPAEGANQLLLTTINSSDGDGLSPQFSEAVNEAAAEGFYDFQVNIPNFLEGSAFELSLTVSPGTDNLITFRYDFLTNEQPPGNRQDFAFAFLRNATTGALIGSVMTVSSPAAINFNDPSRLLAGGNPFQFHTGYQTFSFGAVAPGNYLLGIGVSDRSAFDIPSGLLVDDIRVVPEPSSVALALAGVSLLIGFQRVRAKRQ